MKRVAKKTKSGKAGGSASAKMAACVGPYVGCGDVVSDRPDMENVEVEDLSTPSGGEAVAKVLVRMDRKQFEHLSAGRDALGMLDEANGYVADRVAEACEWTREHLQIVMIAFIKTGAQLSDAPSADPSPERGVRRPREVHGGNGACIGWAFSNTDDVESGASGTLFVALNARGASYWRSLRKPTIDRRPTFASSSTIIVVEGDAFGVAEP